MRSFSIRAILATLAITLSACGPVSQPGLGPDARRELGRASDAATAWITRSRGAEPVDEQTAVAVGYLERLRLGLGSPFRLVDLALDDPRLADTTRNRLAWAILGRTLARNAYHIDAAALDRIGLNRRAPVPGSGRRHLDLIDGVVRQSTDPRGGELAIRLAYMLASSAGNLSSTSPEWAARAAALIRDRELARSDASRLLRAAEDSAHDPIAMIPRWRAERRFEVEQPTMTPLPAAVELLAIQSSSRIARVLGQMAAGDDTDRYLAVAANLTPLIGPQAAERLAWSADSIALPPSAPVAVASMLHGDELVEPSWVRGADKERREHFVAHAVNEEAFVAGHAGLRPLSTYDAGPATVALAAAVALRAWNQEATWMPGQGGPSVRELQERYGLASVTFGDDVRAEWRPYYRRLLAVALADLRLVLPALDLRGLNVMFADAGRREATLALHDPRRRRLVLPPRTAAGTLAHEIAHDLDWQVALRRYRVRGDYASDRAVRLAGDRFGEKLQDLAGASMDSRPSPDRGAHASRPAEVFARNIDWFVAASLASQGRADGYLSSVQDDMLTGYGSVRPPDISGNAGHALVSILDEVAPLYPETRGWFVRNYGRARSLTPYDLLRRVLEAPAPATNESSDIMGGWQGGAKFASIEESRDAAFSAIDAWVCNAPGAAYYPEYAAARRELVLDAARARARGVALQLVRRLGGRIAETWTARRLDGDRGPFADEPDAATREAIEPIIERAMSAGTAVLPSTAARIDILAPPARCAAGPLRITTIF